MGPVDRGSAAGGVGRSGSRSRGGWAAACNMASQSTERGGTVLALLACVRLSLRSMMHGVLHGVVHRTAPGGLVRGSCAPVRFHRIRPAASFVVCCAQPHAARAPTTADEPMWVESAVGKYRDARRRRAGAGHAGLMPG